MKQEQTKNIPAVLTSRNVVVTSIVVGVVFTIMTAWMVVRSADRREQTIRLSNGMVVYLGQSIGQAKQILGPSLKPVNGVANQYKYAPGQQGAVEAVILVSNNRVAGIRLLSNESNVQILANAHIGSKVSEIPAWIRSRMQQLPATTVKTNLHGYTLSANDGSVVYYLTDACSDDDRIIKIVMADNGHQTEALGRVIEVDCDGGGG